MDTRRDVTLSSMGMRMLPMLNIMMLVPMVAMAVAVLAMAVVMISMAMAVAVMPQYEEVERIDSYSHESQRKHHCREQISLQWEQCSRADL